ncbi:MAG: DUF3817 domain-containing protein [Acidimicrobiia bacterium]
MPDFADDPTTELDRKARALMWVAAIETVSYLSLLACMLAGSSVGVKLVGSVHGMIAMAFGAMVLLITRDMQWTWGYAALVILTGPIGGVLVFERIRRHGVPAAAQAAAQ